MLEKLYSRLNFINKKRPALNETNLNHIDKAIDDIDNRVINMNESKFDKDSAKSLVKSVSLDEKTGILTVVLYDNTTKTYNTNISKIAVNFKYDKDRQVLILILLDGTETEIDLADLVTQYEFVDSSTIQFTVNADGTVSATIKNGSITEAHLQTDYLANIKVETANSAQNREVAEASAILAKDYAEQAKESAEQALSTTPEGYNQIVSDVDLLKNSIIQTTDRTLYGSKEGGIKLVGIKGASEQGENPSPDNPQEIESVGDLKNLLDLSGLIESVSNGITFTPIFKSGLLQYILVNGTATAQARYYFPSNLVFEFDTILSLQGATNGGVSGYASGGNVFAEEKTMSAGTSYATFFLFVNSGVTVENVKIYPMIRKASVKNAEYKPYGYSLVIKAEGKNQYDEAIYNRSYSNNGISSSLQADNAINVSGTSTSNANLIMNPFGLPAGRYVYSTPGRDTVSCLLYDNDSKALIKQEPGYFTLDKYTSLDFRIQLGAGKTVNTTFHIMIRKCDSEGNAIGNDAYEPYRSKSITIPLNEPLRGIGVVKDEVVCQDGVWGVNRWSYKKILDSTAVAQGFTNIGTVNRVFFTIGSATVGTSTTTDFMTTSFQKVADYTLDEEHCYLSNGDLFVFINADKLSSQDANGVSNWLADNNVECNFVRATPTFEPFADQTPFYGLESFDTVTYISTDSEVEPSVELKFGKTEGDAVTLLNYNGMKIANIIAESNRERLDSLHKSLQVV